MTRWRIELLNEIVEQELTELGDITRARFVRISELLEEYGLLNISRPHVERIRGNLWGMLLRSKTGNARAFYMPARTRRIVVVRVFEKASETRPKFEIEQALERAQQLTAEPKAINLRAVTDLHAKWKKSAEYANAYAGLEREIEVVSAIISARTRARLTQEQLAERMDTTRRVIARLESGKSIPSRMLVRIGAATGQQIRIGFKVHKKKRVALT